MRVGFSIIVMARTDIFKRIKNDKLIESRIQKYRLHYDYLKFCLENPNEFKMVVSKKTKLSCPNGDNYINKKNRLNKFISRQYI